MQAVESMKRNKGAPRPRLSKREAMANVFGRPFSWRWFSPFHSPTPLTPVIPLSSNDEDNSVGDLNPALSIEMRPNGSRPQKGADNDVYLV